MSAEFGNTYKMILAGGFAVRSTDAPSVPAHGPICGLAASLPRLLLPACLGLAGCDGGVSTKPLDAGLGDTIIHVGNGGHEAWLLGRSEDIGYKFTSVSFLYVDLWTWGGTYCVYQRFEHKCHPISAAEAARLLDKEESDMETPFRYRFPLGWFIFGPLFMLGAVCFTIGRFLDVIERSRSRVRDEGGVSGDPVRRRFG